MCRHGQSNSEITGVRCQRVIADPLAGNAHLVRLHPTLPAPGSFLARDEVDVWFAPLGRDVQCLGAALQVLAPDEVERAERFCLDKDRDQYVLARGILRNILSRYLDIPPAQLRFEYNECGKPALRGDCGGYSLTFNLSHAPGAAVYAVSGGCKVGVDLELVREGIEYEQIAERFFSAHEAGTLCLLPTEAKLRAFFACWTRKEAYIKAKGNGLLLDLKSFDVAFAPSEPASLLCVADDPLEAGRWSLMNLDVPADYVAALVVERALGELSSINLRPLEE
jgi:4'-phosphopantetheinyl transferase